ncbi:MAG TPA: 4-hydroxy-tetrahydrodipicolinate reductase [Bacteroidia bacterium]|nr:4-hydroxy-tetrahydrodipicolinate reductase [Bacteroidia bacterium]
MKIVLFGYGKMGKEIEKIALERGHEILLKINSLESKVDFPKNISEADVSIEFSTPESAVENIMTCFDSNIPVVVGTTGWLQKMPEIKKVCTEKNQGLFYASNFSIGVNLFFQLNTYLAKLMNPYKEYDVTMEEIHHIHKKDAPSGTAITLAEEIIANNFVKKNWTNISSNQKEKLSIVSKRIDEVPGTHTILYQSEVDAIEIKHIANNRKGFAFGAVLAAEWMINKKGIFGMNDLLKK